MSAPGNNTSDHAATDRPDWRDELIARRARALYREASQRIDPTTAGRLRAARREALNAAQTPQRHTGRWLVPAGAFAAIAFAMLVVWQPLSHGPTVPTNQPASASAEQSADADSDLPPDAEKTDPNLYQNLDFYGWLAANSASNGQPANR